MYKSGNFNGKNRWIIKKDTVFKKLLPHLATRGTYSPGDWRCDEAWREQTLVYPPVMCQQRLIYCTWELNVMAWPRESPAWRPRLQVNISNVVLWVRYNGITKVLTSFRRIKEWYIKAYVCVRLLLLIVTRKTVKQLYSAKQQLYKIYYICSENSSIPSTHNDKNLHFNERHPGFRFRLIQ